MHDTAINVDETPLVQCSVNPMTGWFRDGYCRTDKYDNGTHIVCSRVTDAFLQFSKSRGNDLSTPSPGSQFPGLKHGDRWCLCAGRWLEAYNAGKAPPIVKEATLINAREFGITQEQLDWAPGPKHEELRI